MGGQDHEVEALVVSAFTTTRWGQMQPKTFPDQSLEAIPPRGLFANLGRNRQPETRMTEIVVATENSEVAVPGNHRARKNAPKLDRSGQSRRALE